MIPNLLTLVYLLRLLVVLRKTSFRLLSCMKKAKSAGMY